MIFAIIIIGRNKAVVGTEDRFSSATVYSIPYPLFILTFYPTSKQWWFPSYPTGEGGGGGEWGCGMMFWQHLDKQTLSDIHFDITQNILMVLSNRMKQKVLFLISLFLSLYLFSFQSFLNVCSTV